ncbi:MAG: ferrochelatase [Bacteroidetes bacterium]|nr:ferrochelatase [Bacteroidota bacterium]MDA0873744.1 ferrochelatase [Bacteroidota bacterium]
MSPRDLAKAYASDERLFSGRFFSQEPIRPGPGDRVGVVLLVPGAPEKREDVVGYLYHRLMLPPGARSGIKLWVRHLQSQLSARFLSRQLNTEYSSIGGGSAINRLNREQCRDLNGRLQALADLPAGVRFHTYLASPFGTPDILEAVRQMDQDGITHVILLPMFPQYATETTGRALASWDALIRTGKLATRPTIAIGQFATREKYLRSVNERIEQALQRFPKHIRPDVELLFAAHGIPVTSDAEKRDPYCCLVHRTVDGIMAMRGQDRQFSLTFVRTRTWGDQVSNDLQDRLRRMARSGTRAVLVVPVDHVTEQFDTAFVLDVRMRGVAEHAGIPHYHVASGLNCHPLFMDCLADLVRESLDSPGASAPVCGDHVESASHVCPRSSWATDGIHNDPRTEARCGSCPMHPVNAKA